MRHMQSFTPKDEAEMLALGAKLIAGLSAGQVVCLTGGLGAGKTTLVRGMIQSVLGTIDVPSPTYTLCKLMSFRVLSYGIAICTDWKNPRTDMSLD